jgi:hypothetical protein
MDRFDLEKRKDLVGGKEKGSGRNEEFPLAPQGRRRGGCSGEWLA